MTDGLRKSHLRKAPQVGLSEVGLPEGNHVNWQFWLPRNVFLAVQDSSIGDLVTESVRDF